MNKSWNSLEALGSAEAGKLGGAGIALAEGMNF
jgi:hypothetical protein